MAENEKVKILCTVNGQHLNDAEIDDPAILSASDRELIQRIRERGAQALEDDTLCTRIV